MGEVMRKRLTALNAMATRVIFVVTVTKRSQKVMWSGTLKPLTAMKLKRKGFQLVKLATQKITFA
jgi:hypothetical protein